MRILLVENNRQFAAVVRAQFLAEHVVTIVATVAEGVRALGRESFDAVLVDYDLDDGKGDDVARVAAGLRSRPRIVAISSHDAGNTALTQAGADVVCPKPRFARIAEVLAGLPHQGHAKVT